MAGSGFVNDEIRVESPDVIYTDSEILSYYDYNDTSVRGNIITPTSERLVFKTNRHLPKTGLLLVGWGGNNGTTLTAGILANKLNVTWNTKEGLNHPNYLGSICKSVTMRIGVDDRFMPVYTPLNKVVPLVNPNDLEIWGWDISGVNMGDSMRRAKVLDWDLQRQLYSHLKEMIPWPSVYIPE